MIDVITLTRTPAYVQRLSESLELAGEVPQQRWLVNNASDPTIDMLGERYGWRVLNYGRNTTFSEGNNLAAEMGSAPYLLLLNDDAILRSYGAFDALYRHALDGHGLIGCLMWRSDGTVDHTGATFTPDGPRHVKKLWPACRLMPAVTFAVVLISRKVWEDLDGLDEHYRYGYEDTDFCLRYLESGEFPMVCMETDIVHDQIGTRDGRNEAHNAGVFMWRWSGGRGVEVVQRYLDLPEAARPV